jgi:hypothetical protein
VKLITHLYLVRSYECVELYLCTPYMRSCFVLRHGEYFILYPDINFFGVASFKEITRIGTKLHGLSQLMVRGSNSDLNTRVRLSWGISLHHRVQTGSGAQPASYPMDTGGFSLGLKRLEREADHSPPSSAEVKNAWSYTSTPPIRLHGVVLS